MAEQKHILLATLGGQPQVVTFTLDLLLASYPITDVMVMHPRASQPRLQHSLACLQAEFAGDYYKEAQRVIRFRSHLLRYHQEPLDDIIDDLHADGVLDTIHQLVRDLKRQGYRIHLSVTGGRRLMALLAISVAALNFDRHDHIWHIYTPATLQEEAQEGKIMHAPLDAGVKLIQGPFLSLGAYIYNPSPSFRTAEAERRSQMEAQDRTACDNVVKELTPAQLRILRAFSQGLRPQQVAQQLSVSINTVNTHRAAILHHCINAWSLQPQERLDYRFLAAKFANYFDSDE